MNVNDCKVMFSHKNDEYQTPQKLFDLLDAEFHFNVHAAANSENTLCKWYLGEDYAGQKENLLIIDWQRTLFQDGLTQNYCKIFFLNPPYSQIGPFIKKAYEESLKGATVVCLIPVRSDTRYWHDYIMKSEEIRFIKGRLKFTLPYELWNDQLKPVTNSAPFPSCIVVFRNHYGSTNISSYKI